MRSIPLRTTPIKSVDLLRQVLENSPREPLSVDAIRRRCRVLDKIDDCVVDADCLVVEDAEHSTLMHAVESFPWSVANRDILRIIDDVKEAKAGAQHEAHNAS